jgi:ABC-type transport system involved in multi-copper enzyme maturation permease subunit
VSVIHDLGYKRYAGPRRSAGSRWRVIMRNQIATSWKTWWRMKASVGMAVLTTFIAGGVMFIFKEKTVNDLFGNVATTFADSTLPKSIQWYTRAAFLTSLTIGAAVIAADGRSGAFTFYFARSVRPRDYVLGKLTGMIVVMATVNLAGPVLLALARLGLEQDLDGVMRMLPWIPKAMLMGLFSTLVFATVPMMFSASFANPRHALAVWAAYYLVFGFAVSRLGRLTQSWIGVLDISTSLDAIAIELFGLNLFRGRAGHLDPTEAMISIGAHIVIATAVIAVQVRRAHGSGVGGSS